MRRLLLLAFLAYGLLLAGLFTLEGGEILLMLPLLVMLGMAVLTGPGSTDLHVTRHLSSERVTEGQPIEVTVTLRNDGPRIEEVTLRLTPPPELSFRTGETSVLAALGPGEALTLRYEVKGERGVYGLEPVEIVLSDRFGLLRRRERIEPEGADLIDILPEVTRIPRIALRPLQTRIYAGNIPARVGGSGVSFYGVRPYQPADSLRHINWRALARGDLYTNEYEQERIADINIVLDARLNANKVAPGTSLFEDSVGAAAALAEAFLNEGNRVSLLLYGRIVDWTPPGYGKIQRERILRALARAEVGASQIFETFRFLPTRYFPGKSQIVLISSLYADRPDDIIRLRGRGYEVLIVSPDPVAAETRAMSALPGVEMASRVAALERVQLLRRLRQAGVRIVDWDPHHQSLAVAVQASLGRQPVSTRPIGIVPS